MLEGEFVFDLWLFDVQMFKLQSRLHVFIAKVIIVLAYASGWKNPGLSESVRACSIVQ